MWNEGLEISCEQCKKTEYDNLFVFIDWNMKLVVLIWLDHFEISNSLLNLTVYLNEFEIHL